MSQKAVDGKMDGIFYDMAEDGDYSLDRLSAFERDLKKIFDKVKSTITEKKFGSERTAIFLKYLAESVPQHYTKMMKEHY